jgi:NADH:ubiquinone oxidoreductase subunit C
MTQEASREEALVNKLKSQFPEAIKETKIEGRHRILVEFEKSRLLEIASIMLNELGIDHVKGIAGIDYPTRKIIEVLYFTGSYSRPEFEDIVVVLKTKLPRDNPTIASATTVWESAHFHERETFEMFGVKFEGHPDLRKLLTLDNWEGPPPMLKDIKFPEMSQR